MLLEEQGETPCPPCATDDDLYPPGRLAAVPQLDGEELRIVRGPKNKEEPPHRPGTVEKHLPADSRGATVAERPEREA